MSLALTERINTQTPTSEELRALLDLQRAAQRKEGPPSADVRRNRIDRLALAILDFAEEIAEAIRSDFGDRPVALSLATDILGSLTDFEEIRAELEEWMRPTPLGNGSFLQQHPLGVVGVIGAWNFPITLTVQPAIAALAAGNRVIIKMPSTDERTAGVLQRAVQTYFAQEEVAVVTGGGQVSDDFIRLPLDHIMFTGSPAVGSVVQAAAAANLVPVTLELGGKNPMVVDASADLDLAADRVVLSRMANGGQICLCGDYVLVDNSVKSALVDKISERFHYYFPTVLDNPGIVSLVNGAAFTRITGLIEDAVAKGATQVSFAPDNERDVLPHAARRIVAPTLLLDVPLDARINDDEVFGPVLAVHGYDTPEEAIDFVNDRPAPLAAYWYGTDDERFSEFVRLTTSGGVTRNDGFRHSSTPGAPFGGVGRSGYGAYHGKFGFDAFTHRRPIVVADDSHPSMAAFVGPALGSPQLLSGVKAGVAQLLGAARARVTEYEQRES